MEPVAALQPIWDDELSPANLTGPDWLVQGLIARGCMTLLTSQWKAGKTTWLSLLLSRRATGGQVGGLTVLPGKTVVVSEESPAIWADRARRYRFGGNTCFFPQPFLGVPRPEQWQALVDRILDLRRTHGIDLVAIDPLAPFVPCENSARGFLDMLLPLQALTRAGAAVLLCHHPAKGAPSIGQAARGSGALLGHVDISIEMRHPGGDPLTRRRRFHALSRFEETPRDLLLELNADATDYLQIADEADDGFDASWQVVRMVLEDAPRKLTRLEMLAEWPDDFDKPSPVTLSRCLKRAVEDKLVRWEGSGRKCDPLRYWLAETEAKWRREAPAYQLTEQERRDLARLLRAPPELPGNG